MKIIYSFNKQGFEADYWTREIAAASTQECQFVPFNHDSYLNPNLYIRAQLLDNLYYQEHSELMRMYKDVTQKILEMGADVLMVDTCPPYHPDFLRRLDIYKVLRIADGPMSAYDRDFAYAHAYDHILFNSPAYSRDMGMQEKLEYVGAKRADFWPHALFNAAFDTTQTEETILMHERDIDVLFIGAQHINKMSFLARIKKSLGKHCRIYGLTNLKRNLYFNFKFGFPGWVRPVPFNQCISLYQRTKIGFNLHNRTKYTTGNYRLFDLPGNGVMQISDGGTHLDTFFKTGDEIMGYNDADDLIEKIHYFLEHDDERQRIALNGFKRVMKDHRIAKRLHEAATLIAMGMRR